MCLTLCHFSSLAILILFLATGYGLSQKELCDACMVVVPRRGAPDVSNFDNHSSGGISSGGIGGLASAVSVQDRDDRVEKDARDPSAEMIESCSLAPTSAAAVLIAAGTASASKAEETHRGPQQRPKCPQKADNSFLEASSKEDFASGAEADFPTVVAVWNDAETRNEELAGRHLVQQSEEDRNESATICDRVPSSPSLSLKRKRQPADDNIPCCVVAKVKIESQHKRFLRRELSYAVFLV